MLFEKITCWLRRLFLENAVVVSNDSNGKGEVDLTFKNTGR
jgi:hypothetical protein